MGKDKQQRFGGIDEGLLEEFENELAEEERSRRTRFTIILMGIVIGAVVGVILTLSGGDYGNEPIQETQVIEGGYAKEDEITEVPAPQVQKEDSVSVGEPEFKAPDILVTDKPMEIESSGKGGDERVPEDEQFFNPLRDIHKDIDSIEKADLAKDETPQPDVVISTPEKEPKKPAPKPVKPVVKVKSVYAVRTLATTDAVLAIQLKDRLKKRGYNTWISQGKVRQNIYRVEAGKFRSIKEASALSVKLAKAGFHTRTSYIKRGSKVTLEVGVYRSKKRAQQMVKLLKKFGFKGVVRGDGGALDLYVVFVGKYHSYAKAKRIEKYLSKVGYRTLGIARME